MRCSRRWPNGVSFGPLGKTDRGIVAVTSLWADDRVDSPLHGRPSPPANRLPQARQDPAFRTKPQFGVELVDAALAASVSIRVIVADCGDGDNPTFRTCCTGRACPTCWG